MNAISQSAGQPAVISSTVENGNDTSSVSPSSRAPRDGCITLAASTPTWRSTRAAILSGRNYECVAEEFYMTFEALKKL